MTATAQVEPQSEPIRLRITWGGGDATRWLGQIATDRGALSDLRVANLNADAAGSVWLEDHCVKINSISDHELDAIEVTAAASLEAKLLVQLVAPTVSEPIRAEVPLADLSRQPFVLQLDELGSSLKVEALPQNALRITSDRQQLIFAPAERFAFELHPKLAEAVPGTTLDIQTSLSTDRLNETLWSDRQTIAVPVEGDPTLVVSVPLPRAEGVYTVRVVASLPPGFRDRFFPGAAPPLATRSFQVVVVDPLAAASTEAATWEEVLTIDPTNPRWWERLPAWTQLRRIPGLNRRALGSSRTASVELPLGRFVELPPTVAGSDPHWQAYSLPLEAAGVPHMLQIDYPANEPQSFAVSLLELNAFGVIDGAASSSGVYVEGLGLSEEKQHHTHELVFWPRTQAPLLLLTNQHPAAPARFGAIRVLKHSGERLAGRNVRSPQSERMVAAYFAHPLVNRFGIEQPISDGRRADLPFQPPDWQSLYRGTSRLVDYLQFAGYNSAVIAVDADRGTPARRQDSEQHVAPSANHRSDELPEPDGLELMLRAFDREELLLVPALQLDSPLPELETLRRASDPRISGLEWVGPNGQTWLARQGTQHGRAAYYNLLSPRVQQAILQNTRDFLDRYSHHPALGGLAIQLSSHGYAQLPPLEWGLDDATIARFERDTGLAIDAEGPNRFAARYKMLSANGKYAGEWRSWRTQQVAEFYRQLAALVRAKNGHCRLLLTTEQSFDHAELAACVLPNILSEPKVAATLLDLGIDRRKLEAIPGVVVCPTHYVEPTIPLHEHAVQLEINEAFATLRQAPNMPIAGALLYHRPQQLVLSSLASKSPIPIVDDFQLSCQPLAHGSAVDQPYAMLLADCDCQVVLDGGPRLPLGQEDTLRAARTVLRRLPISAAVEVTIQQPVSVKSYAEPNATTVLVVNTCPWITEAQIEFKLPRPSALEPLLVSSTEVAVDSTTPPVLAPDGPPWMLTLEPYGIRAVRIATGGVKVTAVKAQVSNGARAEIAARLADLNNRDTQPHRFEALINPGFEPIGGQPVLPGWRLLASPGVATVELDGTLPQEGTTCLHVRTTGTLAVIESDPFLAPLTGQFAFTASLRAKNLAPNSEVRMVLQSEGEPARYHRFRRAGGQYADAFRLEDRWCAYPLLVNDLPLQSQQKLRVRFEFSGPGEWWLDDINTYDLLFPLTFYVNKEPEWIAFQSLIRAAEYHHKNDQMTDCIRYLDGYWPRFLVAHTTPRAPARVARQPIPATNAAERPAPAEPSGFDKFWRLFRR